MIDHAGIKKGTASARKTRAEAFRLKALSLIPALYISLSIVLAPAEAAEVDPVAAGGTTAEYIVKTFSEPYPGDVGGEWVIAALGEGGFKRPDGYFEDYYGNLVEFLKERGGVISERKYAEYSKTIYAVTAAGYNAANVAGYDLTLPLGDFEATIAQGINGPIWALIALDSGNYDIPDNPKAKTRATREKYVDYILSRELEGGGFAFMGKYADPDITAMALQALSKYTYREDVAAAVAAAVKKLSELQQPDGGYKSMGDPNAESVSQVIIALCRLGISINDQRFMKNGLSPLDNLMTYRNEDGSFCHLKGDGGNPVATEQAFSALAALAKITRERERRRPGLERTLIFKAETGRYKGILRK